MKLRLGLLQYEITRIENLAGYAARFDALVAAAAPRAELLLMPEYACMELAAAFVAEADPVAELAAIVAQADAILAIMRETAMRHRVWLQPGTVPARDANGEVHNRAPLITPDGAVAYQEKHVMTRFEAESWGVRPGTPPAVFETPWGRIGIAICYDCEFPGLVRAQVAAGAWLILVPTCTDTPHGFNRVKISARARAVENQCFVAVSPTVGNAPWLGSVDANRGQTAVFGPVDHGFPADGIIAEAPADTPGWLFATLDPDAIAAVREAGAVRNHRDWPEGIAPARPFLFEEKASQNRL